MASAEDYAAWIVKNADKKGTPEFETVASAYQAARASASEMPSGGMSDETRATLLAAKPLDRGGRGIVGETLHQAGNFAAGAARGAGSIGATILAPVDWAMDKLEGKGGHTLSSLITGQKPLTRNEQRRADMDAALRELGNDTDSAAYTTGKIGSEIAGTLGVGGVLGNAARGAQAIPAVGRFIPAGLPAALTTAGMDAQGGNILSRLALRTGAGAATGAASAGLIDPENATTGAVIGAIFPNALKLAGTAGRAVTGAVKGVNDAFRNPMAVAGRTLQRFGITPDDVQGLSSAPTATGARTTLAEQIPSASGSAGAARLQDALRLNPELSPAIEARIAENNAARVATLKNLAGEGGARSAAIEARSDIAKQLYQDAFKNNGALTPSQLKAQADLLKSGRIEKLMQSPAIQEAMSAARTNAENAGQVFRPEGSIEGLHNMKLAIDDMIKSPDTAAQAAKVRGLEQARERLIDVIETLSPAYKGARTQYAAMSAPVNQMDVAGELLKRGTAASGDLAGTPRLMPDAYLRSLSNESQLIKNATGRELGGSLDKVLQPSQLNAVRAVGDELNKLAAVGRVGNGPGSATAGRFASTNLLERMGVPAGLTESPIAQTIMRPVQFGMKMAEPRINQTLLDIIQNPAMAREAMKAATPAERGAIMKALAEAAKQSPKAAGALAELTNNGE
jgi:hypothetical protein